MSKAKGKKLVEILAVELKEWPEAATHAAQDNYCSHIKKIWLLGGRSENTVFINHFDGWSLGDGVWPVAEPICAKELATDYATAIVTRAQWEAERAKLSKPKANKDGWIRHRGGKCPVEKGVMVDVRFRDGGIAENCKALTRESGHEYLHAKDWSHSGDEKDIMAYRILQPARKSGEKLTDSEMPAQAPIDGPLQWRDRIAEIDAEEARLNTEHRSAIEAIEEERVSLVQRLADEGLQLIGKKAE